MGISYLCSRFLRGISSWYTKGAYKAIVQMLLLFFGELRNITKQDLTLPMLGLNSLFIIIIMSMPNYFASQQILFKELSFLISFLLWINLRRRHKFIWLHIKRSTWKKSSLEKIISVTTSAGDVLCKKDLCKQEY